MKKTIAPVAPASTSFVEAVGAKGKLDPERVAVRHGHESGQVTLGGRRVAVERPRVRSADGRSELPLRTYRHFADRDPLTRVVFGADARRCLHAPLPPNAGAGRRAGRAGRALLDDHDQALDRLKLLAAELARSHPGAAASLREGIAETLDADPPGHQRPVETSAHFDESLRVTLA